MVDKKEEGSFEKGLKWDIKFRENEKIFTRVEYHRLFLWYETPISVHKKYFLALVKAKQNGGKIIPVLWRGNEI